MSRVLPEVESVTVIVKFKDGYESPAVRAFLQEQKQDGFIPPSRSAMCEAYERCIELANKDTK